MNIIEYDLGNRKKLYFFPEYNRFSYNKSDVVIKPDYNDISLFKLRLEISYLCNGKCKYCLVFGNKVERKEILDISDLWNTISVQDWFKSITNIFIIGGEPLLHFKEISYLLDHFNGRISFSTNGTLLTKEMIQKFSKSNVSVYISLDGPDFKDNLNRIFLNDEYMYPKVIEGINLLKKYNVPFGIFMVATPETIKKAPEMIMELDKLYSPTRIGYNLPHWTSDYINDDVEEDYKNVLIELYKNRKKIHAEIPQIKWRLDPLCNGKIKLFSCGLHTTQTTILPDKSVVRCSKLDNINDNLKSKVTNDELNKGCPVERAKRGEEPCSKCIALSCCGGGCPFDGMKRFNCTIDKRECIITPPLISLAIKDIINAFKKGYIDVPEGLIDPKIVNNIIYGEKND